MIYLPFFVLCYVIKSSSAHPQRSSERQWQVEDAKYYPTLDVLQEPSAYQRPISTNPEEHSGIMASGGNPNYGLSRRDALTWPHPGLSQESLSPSVQARNPDKS